MAARDRIVPMVVACPLFLQNLDTSVMATALPSIARSLDVQVLHLNLAITSYLLSLAVFLPLSGWFAERFGARRVFCGAIAFFSLGSALCGAANSLPSLVLFRVLQGLGGAMMVPVGRLILLRSVPPARMVAAMVWFTVPPAIGRMAGPLFGGAIVTWTSWRWIFLINIPFGLLGIALALTFIDEHHEDAAPAPFDAVGFVLLALGLTALLGAMEATGKALVAGWLTGTVAALGALALGLYGLRSRRKASPIIDLGILRYPTYRASIIGGMPLRIAIGASPFLLPLMLQLGFGLSPLASGMLTVATAIGSLATRTVMAQAIRRIGFRSLLIGATTLTSLFYASYGLFRPDTPHVLMFCVLMLGGLVNSMGMVALQTLGFSEIPKPRMSHATTLSSMAQQVSVSIGVVFGASLVSAAAWWHGGSATHLMARDFSPAFVVVGAMTLLSLCFFVRLGRDEGAELR
ncbi:MDR family MFS transporter [Polaromonas sp. C04]|uniref:MDR family MFS transporter n=1 Tax=Polaromonas sp. C04 TaxID=1945857 RepID=UPI000985B69E|nr:MDR family MFS transporter [Polaromonas sp. C04]OOG55694.1 MFS transporter [Polaromonas sp. C04]